MAGAEEVVDVQAATWSEGLGSPEAWGVIHTNAIEGTNFLRDARQVAAETTRVFAAMHELGRVIVGDEVLQGARRRGEVRTGGVLSHRTGVPGIPAGYRYITHRAADPTPEVPSA